jgi:hypothetical protein
MQTFDALEEPRSEHEKLPLDVAYYVRVIDAALPRIDRFHLGEAPSLAELLALRERARR